MSIKFNEEESMALIKTVDPEKAEGIVKEVFDTMMESVGMIPAPMQLASASPGLLDISWQSLQYFSQHPKLGFGLLCTIHFKGLHQYTGTDHVCSVG